MSLRSTDITKVKRLSLQEVKLPPPEQTVEPITPILVDRSPTAEEIAYSKLVAINPLIDELIESLDLVGKTTAERIKKVELREDIKTTTEPEPQEIDKLKLIAQRVVERQSSYSKEDIVDRIREATNVSQERAEKGFYLILQAGAIEPMQGKRYYLTGSTPF